MIWKERDLQFDGFIRRPTDFEDGLFGCLTQVGFNLQRKKTFLFISTKNLITNMDHDKGIWTSDSEAGLTAEVTISTRIDYFYGIFQMGLPSHLLFLDEVTVAVGWTNLVRLILVGQIRSDALVSGLTVRERCSNILSNSNWASMSCPKTLSKGITWIRRCWS